YRVDGDPGPGPFLGQRFGETVDSRLGGGVVDLSVLPGLAVDRADVDDAPEAARAHAVDDRAAHVEAGGEVGLDHLVPLLPIHALQRGVAGDAGVVDQDLDRSQRSLDRLHALLAGGELAHVELEGGDAGLLGEGPRSLLIAVIGGRYLVACL